MLTNRFGWASGYIDAERLGHHTACFALAVRNTAGLPVGVNDAPYAHLQQPTKARGTGWTGDVCSGPTQVTASKRHSVVLGVDEPVVFIRPIEWHKLVGNAGNRSVIAGADDTVILIHEDAPVFGVVVR